MIQVSQGENMKRKGIKVSALVLAAITVASMTFTWAQAQPEDFRLPSPGFSPGHPLYGVELFVEENIEVPLARLTRGRLGEAEKRLRLSEERLAEIEAVCNRTDAAALERLRYRYELQMNKTLAMVNATDSPDLETWTAERAMNHVRVLTRIRARVPEEARQGLDNAVQSSVNSFATHMRRMAYRVQQVESEGGNATELYGDMESLRARVQERLMELNRARENAPTPGFSEDIQMPPDPLDRGNRSRRGTP
jgi:hypothetical protein